MAALAGSGCQSGLGACTTSCRLAENGHLAAVQPAQSVIKPGRWPLPDHASNRRPVVASRGFYRVNLRHGVNEVGTGQRHTLGIIFMTLSKRLSADNGRVTTDLFEDIHTSEPAQQTLAPGAVLLRGFAREAGAELLARLELVLAAAPLRHLVTPGGHTMSVAMSNCGPLGWVSSRSGYRYEALDPLSGQPWPPMPESWRALARRAATQAGFDKFAPDACLINQYLPGSKLSLHQDKDENDFSAPIVSVSLGLPAVFLFGTPLRNGRPQRYRLQHGDVVVWGGPARLAFHGVAPLADGNHALLGQRRINLTFRCAG